jgi:hypothetical protein
MLERFLASLQAAHVAFLDAGQFERWAEPSQRGNRRLAGLDLNKARNRTVIAALSGLATHRRASRRRKWPKRCGAERVGTPLSIRPGERPMIWPKCGAKDWWSGCRGDGVMNVGPNSCGSCAGMWSCANRSSNPSWPDSHTRTPPASAQALDHRPALPSPAGRVAAHLPDPRLGGLKVARRKTQKNDNMLVFLFGLGILRRGSHETPEGLPAYPREWAGRLAVGEGPEAGLLRAPTRAGAIDRTSISPQSSIDTTAARLGTAHPVPANLLIRV